MVLAIFAASPWIVEFSARKLLESEGVMVQKLDLEHPGIQTVHSDGIELEVAGHMVIAKNITVTYALTELTIEKIEIETLIVRAMHQQAEATSNSTSIESVLATLDTLWQQLPAQQLNIQLVDFSSTDMDLQVTGKFTIDQADLQATIENLNTAWAEALSGEVYFSRPGKLRIELQEKKSGHQQNRFTLSAQMADQTFTHTLQLHTPVLNTINSGSGSWTKDAVSLQITPGGTASIDGKYWDSPGVRIEIDNPKNSMYLMIDATTTQLTEGPLIRVHSANNIVEARINNLETDYAFTDIQVDGNYH